MSIFSERLAELLANKNISQKELANKAEVTESAISHYINGERIPGADVLSRISKALNCSTDYLLGNSSEISVGTQQNDELRYLHRNLGKLNSEDLKKAENLLKAVFDNIFEDD